MKDKKDEKTLTTRPVDVDGIAEINGERYYTKDKAYEVLEVISAKVTSDYFSSVWNVSYIAYRTRWQFYRCYEIDNIIEKTEEYYRQLYSVDDVMKLFNFSDKNAFQRNKEIVAERTSLDIKYKYFLRRTYKDFLKIGYNKKGIDALLSKDEKTLTTRPVDVDGIAEINGERYYTRDKAYEILEIVNSKATGDYFSSVWNVECIGNTAIGTFYICCEIDDIREKAEEYYKQLYSNAEVEKLFNIESLPRTRCYKEIVAERTSLDIKYKYFLRRTYKDLLKDGYKKKGIEALVSEYLKAFPSEREDKLDGETYYNLSKIKDILEVRSSRCAPEILEDEWGLSCLIRDGARHSKLFKASDIDNVLKETDEYYKELYHVKEVAEILGIDAKKIYNHSLNVVKIDSKYKYFLRYKYEKFKTYAVRKSDVEHLIESINNTPKNKVSVQGEYRIDVENVYIENTRYYRPETVKEKLQTSRLDDKIFEDWNVKSIYVDGAVVGSDAKGSCRLYEAIGVDKMISETTNYFNRLYSLEEVRETLSESNIKENLTPVNVPEKYKGFIVEYSLFRKSYYKKEDVDALVYGTNSSYTFDEISQMFNITKYMTKGLIKEYNIKVINARGHSVYLKEEVDNLLTKRKAFLEEHILISNIPKYFGQERKNTHFYKGLEKIELPSYAKDLGSKKDVFAFRKIEVDKRLLEYVKTKEILNLSNISGDTYSNTFELRLNAYVDWDEFLTDSKDTREYWVSYAKDWLDRTNSKRKTAYVLINRFVLCTPYMKDFIDRTGKKEIYELTSNEVNLVMRSIKVLTHYKTIYAFLGYVVSDRISKNLPTSYKMSQILTEDKLFEVSEEDKESTIYSFEGYAKVFDYCVDIESRVDLSIKEIDKRGIYKELSTWLYVILHLNNAWRNGNIIDFPRLYVDDILDENTITTMNWFKENTIDVATARRVVFRVVQKEIQVYKTQVKGTFFCSDELAPAFATAVLMLSLKHRESVDKEGSIMIFGTQHNEINDTMTKSFFKGIGIEGFKFGSKKFNKTVMTYIYYIANITGDSKALVYAMKLRAHIEASTLTNHYLILDKDKVAALGNQLFKRGEFGYIPTLLAKKLNGGELTFEETTREVELINQSFDDIVQINTTVGFMNDMMAKKRKVFDFIDNLTLSEAQQHYTDLYLRNSPSKDSTDIQCPFGKKNCKHTEIDDCFDCEFHIPTIHALTDLTKRMKIAIEGYQSATTLTEKFRYALSVERKKVVIKEAMAKFGKELVYEYLGMNREEFLGALAIVPKKERLVAIGRNMEV